MIIRCPLLKTIDNGFPIFEESTDRFQMPSNIINVETKEPFCK